MLAFQNPGSLHRDQPVPGRQGDPGQPGHPAGLHLLGRRRPAGRPDLHAAAFRRRPVGEPELGHPVRPGARDRAGGRRGEVGLHRGGRRVRRHRVRGGRPGQPQPAVRAERADLGGGRGQPAHGRGRRRGRPGGHALAEPGRLGASTPGTRARATAPRWPRCCSARSTRAATCRSPSPPTCRRCPRRPRASSPGPDGQVQYSEGIDVGYRYYDANNETPLFPFGYGLSYTTFRFSRLSVTPRQRPERHVEPGHDRLRLQRAVGPAGDGVGHRHQHRQGGRLRRGAAVPGRPGRGRRAAAPAQGIPEGHAAARPVHDRALHPHRPRPVVLERRGQRLGGPRRHVRRLRRRLLGAGQPAAARRASRSTARVGARYATVSAPATVDAGHHRDASPPPWSTTATTRCRRRSSR